MTAVAAVPAAVPPPILVMPPTLTPPPAAKPGLPSPLLAGLVPDDALGQMLLLIQQSGQNNVALTETRIQAAREKIREQLDSFLEQLRQSIEAARKAQEDDDDGGWFGSIISFVGDLVGSVIGTIVDFAWDSITLPVDIIADVVTHLNDPGSMLASIQSDVLDLGKNGDVADSVSGFTSGVIKFAADLGTFAGKLAAAITAAAASGNNVWDAMKDDAGQLWTSLKKNVLENPHFWEVMSVVGKVAAVAAAVVSGGTLAWVAVGLIALSELDKQTGFIEKAVGKDAAPWVKLGIGLATMACMGWTAFNSPGGGADWMNSLRDQFGSAIHTLQGVTAIVEGAGTVYAGYRALVTADERADDLDRQANLQETLNRMQQLQRLMSNLIDLLRDQSKDQSKEQELGSDLVQTQGAMNTAALMPA